MQVDLFNTQSYQKLISSHLENTIHFLFENDQEFALACETEFLSFNPPLPQTILDGFGETVLFILTGYTYETSKIEDGEFSFEAGFGEENFGSHVSLPLLAIKQIFVGEYPITINISTATAPHQEVDITQRDSSRSMEALLNNPKNKKLLKRKNS